MSDSQKRIICPDCQSVVVHDGVFEVGDVVECQECGTEVEVTMIEPLTYREIIETK